MSLVNTHFIRIQHSQTYLILHENAASHGVCFNGVTLLREHNVINTPKSVVRLLLLVVATAAVGCQFRFANLRMDMFCTRISSRCALLSQYYTITISLTFKNSEFKIYA